MTGVLLYDPVRALRTPSPREFECLRHLANGLEDGEIAKRLGITNRTVRFHIDNVKRRLAANNRAHLVALATREGLID